MIGISMAWRRTRMVALMLMVLIKRLYKFISTVNDVLCG